MSSSAVRGPILVVEDDKKTASLVQLYLEREGFETVLAYDGGKALELARRHNPIFIILDLMLPVVDGWDVCRELRKSSDVPILMLTARSLKGRPLQLTPHEYKLLQALMASPGRVFTRNELLDHLYPSGEAVIDRVIDVHIGKLRQKIEEDSSNPQYIQTVRGIGYQFAESSGS